MRPASTFWITQLSNSRAETQNETETQTDTQTQGTTASTESTEMKDSGTE